MTFTTGPRSRWALGLLAAAVPALLIAGLAGASVVARDQDRGGDSLVAAAGGQGDNLRQPGDPALYRAPAPSAQATDPATDPVAIPVPPTAPPVPPTTTAPPVTEASAPTVPTTAATAARPTMTLVSRYPAAVTMNLNGIIYELAPGQEIAGLTVGPQTEGNDILYLARVDVPTCGEGDADSYFRAGNGHYVVAIVPGRGICPGDMPAPDLSVTPA